jgi:hypothetical protein
MQTIYKKVNRRYIPVGLYEPYQTVLTWLSSRTAVRPLGTISLWMMPWY